MLQDPTRQRNFHSFINWETNEDSEQLLKFNESYKALARKNLQKFRASPNFNHVNLLNIQRKESLLTERKKKNQQSMAQIFGKDPQDGSESGRRLNSQTSMTREDTRHMETQSTGANEYKISTRVSENSLPTRNYQLPEVAESPYKLPQLNFNLI